MSSIIKHCMYREIYTKSFSSAIFSLIVLWIIVMCLITAHNLSLIQTVAIFFRLMTAEQHRIGSAEKMECLEHFHKHLPSCWGFSTFKVFTYNYLNQAFCVLIHKNNFLFPLLSFFIMMNTTLKPFLIQRSKITVVQKVNTMVIKETLKSQLLFCDWCCSIYFYK